MNPRSLRYLALFVAFQLAAPGVLKSLAAWFPMSAQEWVICWWAWVTLETGATAAIVLWTLRRLMHTPHGPSAPGASGARASSFFGRSLAMHRSPRPRASAPA